MNAEILCVGTELLLGDIVNTNAAFLARELAACGIGCYYQTVVGDNPERLRACLGLAFSRADMVITTGGLGPTYDDLTKETVAAHFGRKMQLHEESLARVRAFFAKIGAPMTENNLKQAYMPEGARVFANDRGTAPGLALEADGKIAIMLPGPPREMTAMFERQVKPYLLSLSDETLVSHSIHLFGIGESSIEAELREYMQARSNPTIAPYAKEGEVLLRVTARARGRAEAEALIRPVLDELSERYADYVYGIDVGNLETALVQALKWKSRLAVAEVATGGLLSQRITSVEDSGKVFAGGIIPAQGDQEAELPVYPARAARDLESENAALALARSARSKYRADIGIGVGRVSGSAEEAPEAGPGGKSVCIAVCSSESHKVVRFPLTFAGIMHYERHLISSRALHLALQLAR